MSQVPYLPRNPLEWDGQYDSPPTDDNGWISVKDRLPDNQFFLGFCPTVGIHSFKKEDEHYRTGGWEFCLYCGGQSTGIFEQNKCIGPYEQIITHWMPLPEPPK